MPNKEEEEASHQTGTNPIGIVHDKGQHTLHMS